MIVLEEYTSAQELSEAEIHAIAYFKSIGCDLTNGTDGGDGGAPMTGKTHSEEAKMKISLSQKNVSEEFKNKRAKRLKERPIHLGCKHSDDTKTKMSKSHTGKNVKLGAKINNTWLNNLRNLLNLRPLA
ncbi:MAG: NUMOD3 domain-containing DNA-binding protein [Nitrosotalea sp.]